MKIKDKNIIVYMKNILFLMLPLFLFCPMLVQANTPIFTNENEIDAYYDKKKKDTREYYEGKIEELYDWKDSEIDRYRKEYKEGVLGIYRKSLGDNLTWDMIDKYLPENNPNPEEIYWDTLYNPYVDGISKIKIMFFINEKLLKEVTEIINSKNEENTVNTARIEQIKINERDAKKEDNISGNFSKKDIVSDKKTVEEIIHPINDTDSKQEENFDIPIKGSEQIGFFQKINIFFKKLLLKRK